MDDIPTTPLLGGRYRMLRRLGRGGMSDVHVARDEVLGRDVAVKVVRPDGVGDVDGVARLEREARAVASLSHPHVIVVHDVLRDGGGAAVVMELVDGGTLADRIREDAPLPWREAAALAARVADGLAAAHTLGLVHRDVKPSNVLLGTDGRVKVADFGIAGLVGASTHTTTIRGSIPYLAPEQARGERPDPRTDVYALGCVLYEMLTGRPPFADDQGAAIIGQHLHRAPEPPVHLLPDLPPAMNALVLRMLAKEPADRPADMATVRQELQALADGDTGAAPTAVLPPDAPAADVPTEVIAVNTPTTSPGGAARRRQAVVAAAVGTAVVATLLVGWAMRAPADAPAPIGASPTEAATTAPSPAPEPTSRPETAPPNETAPPARPGNIPEAAEAFRRTLVAGRSDGLASSKAVDELDERVTEILAKDREGKAKDVREKSRELGDAIDELVEKDELSDALGADLQEAARAFLRLVGDGAGGEDEEDDDGDDD